MKVFLGIDIGASSGRHIVGYEDSNKKIVTEEVYRFKNKINEYEDHLMWDIEYLFLEVKKGIKIALGKYSNIYSLAIDTWGVDYVLINNNEEIFPCYCYRDSRTKEVINEVHKLISFEEIYKRTGIQFQEFNTIYQLYDDLLNSRLNNVSSFLMIPEYLNYKLTGIIKKEYTNATTTALVNKNSLEFDEEIIEKLKLPKSLFTPLSGPKEIVGMLKQEIIEEVGGNIKVILCASHDTASAVNGVDIDKDTIYLSSGTWSLLGIKSNKVLNNKKSFLSNYSNEGGINYIRYQKNIMGLWIIQCLEKELNLSIEEMISLAKKSTYQELFPVNDNLFLAPKNMKEEIINYFFKRKMILPSTTGDLINSCFHSLAFSYQEAIIELENNTGKKYHKFCVFGGGAKNTYLNELIYRYVDEIKREDESIRIKIEFLPIEATIIGNIKIQVESEKENNAKR